MKFNRDGIGGVGQSICNSTQEVSDTGTPSLGHPLKKSKHKNTEKPFFMSYKGYKYISPQPLSQPNKASP